MIRLNTLVSLCLMLILTGDCIKSTNAESGESFDTCITGRQEPGLCINVKDCKPAIDILQRGRVSDRDRAYLLANQCGYRDGNVLICCPNISFEARFNTDDTSLPELPNCPFEFNDRVKGGYDTNFDEYPWTARIEYTISGTAKKHLCGGSLISNQYVLTAAHCTTGKIPSNARLTGVRLGEWDTTTNPDCVVDERGNKDCADEYVDVPVEKIIPHPHYQSSQKNHYHDIALLRLAQTVRTSYFIQPICLPMQTNLQDELFTGKILDVAGWGVTETAVNSYRKQTANLTVWNLVECRNKYFTQQILLGGGQMCAGGVGGIDSCPGDSGGPLIYRYKTDKAYFFLAGIVSFGQLNCGQAGWPGVYTRVGQYINWIRQNIEP